MPKDDRAKFSKEAMDEIKDLMGNHTGYKKTKVYIKSKKNEDSPIKEQRAITEERARKQKRFDEIVKQYAGDPIAQIKKLEEEEIIEKDSMYIDKEKKEILFRDPRKYGYDELSLEEVMKLADMRIERLSVPTFYKASTRANLNALSQPSKESYATRATKQEIQDVMYNTYFRSYDRKWDLTQPTMATNGREIFMNPYFVLSLSLEGLKFIIAHEIMHIVLSHLRRFNTNPEDGRSISKSRMLEDSTVHMLYNIALDLVINGILVSDEWGEIPKTKIKDENGKEKEVVACCYIKGFEDYVEEESITELGNTFCSQTFEVYKEICAEKNRTPKLTKALKGKNVREVTENMRQTIRLLIDEVEEQLKQTMNQQGQQGQGKPGFGRGGGGGQSQNSQEQGQGSGSGQKQDSDNREQDQQGQGDGNQNREDGQSQEDSSQNGDGGFPDMSPQERRDMAADIVAKIMDTILQQTTGSSKTLDDHSKSAERIKEYAKENGYPNAQEAIKNDIDINTRQIIDTMMDDLASKGITPEMAAGIGRVGASSVKAWKVSREQPHRDYKIEVMEFFKKIKGDAFNSWDKWNKKNNATRSAARAIARSGGGMKTILHPSTYNTRGRVIVAIDTSGSIYYDEQSMKFAASEVMRLASELEKRKGAIFDIVCCDTEIKERKQIKAGTGEFREYMEELETQGMKMTGSGGTDLLPIWELATNKDMKYDPPGTDKPSGMIIVTDTQTMNADKIAEMYKNRDCTIPTMILVPNEECIVDEWKNLEKDCGIVGIGIIEELLKREKEMGYSLDAEPEMER